MTDDTTTARHFTASMVVLDQFAAKVLLVWHKGYDRLVFPGGHVEPGEDPCETALREVREETGVKAVPAYQDTYGNLPGMLRLANPWITCEIPAATWRNSTEPAHSHIDFLFLGTADSKTPLVFPPDEVDTAEWVPVEDVPFRRARSEVTQLAELALRILSGPPPGWPNQ